MSSKELTFAKALEEPFYQLDNNDNQITRDRNGHPISPIRHVRCYARAGVGELKFDTALKIKKQTYSSKYNYKNIYYAQNEDNYLCLLYEGIDKGKQKRAFRLINYFDAAQLQINKVATLANEPEFSYYNRNHICRLKP